MLIACFELGFYIVLRLRVVFLPPSTPQVVSSRQKQRKHVVFARLLLQLGEGVATTAS